MIRPFSVRVTGTPLFSLVPAFMRSVSLRPLRFQRTVDSGMPSSSESRCMRVVYTVFSS